MNKESAKIFLYLTIAACFSAGAHYYSFNMVSTREVEQARMATKYHSQNAEVKFEELRKQLEGAKKNLRDNEQVHALDKKKIEELKVKLNDIKKQQDSDSRTYSQDHGTAKIKELNKDLKDAKKKLETFEKNQDANQNSFSQHPAQHSSGGGDFFSVKEQNTTDKNTDSKAVTSTPDSSIIILSSLIPTHPSIKMLNDTFNSISMLDGIDPRTPIYISVDGLPASKLNQENIHTLHEYVKSLRIRFQDDPRVTIVNNYEHGHVSNSIGVVLELVKTEFIYMLQHDLKFTKRIDHTALVKSMREKPKKIQIVRFGKDRRPGMIIGQDCQEHRIVKANGLNFTLGKWSDHNHFTTRAYYERLLADLGPVGRFPEAPMMYQSTHAKPPRDCTYMHQYIYNIQEGPFIEHLDGRLSTSYRRSR